MKVFILLGFLFVCEDARSQLRKITGIVRDANSGEFLSSASVGIAGFQGGATTNANGSFTCMVPVEKSALIISYAGYRTDTVQLDADLNHYTIDMTPSVNILRKVEVTTGVSRATSVKETPVPVVVISARTIDRSTENNIIDALAQSAPGFNSVKNRSRCIKTFYPWTRIQSRADIV